MDDSRKTKKELVEEVRALRIALLRGTNGFWKTRERLGLVGSCALHVSLVILQLFGHV